MKFAKWTFWLAGVYGLLVLLPNYAMEQQLGRDYPPVITHAEYFYGFVGCAAAWQLAFLIIGCDPQRYRLLMLAGVAEKFSFAGASLMLRAQGRIPTLTFGFAMVDLMLGVLFLAAFWAARRGRPSKPLLTP